MVDQTTPAADQKAADVKTADAPAASTTSTAPPADAKAADTTASTTSTPSTTSTTASSDAPAEPAKPGDVIPLSDPEVAGPDSPVQIVQPDGNTAIAQSGITMPHTVEDQNGIPRIVQTVVNDGWEPAATDPSDVDVARANERIAREEERADAIKNGRVDPVSGKLLTKEEWDARDNGTRVAASRASSDEEASA